MLFLLRGIPCFFERFSLLLQGFQGFGREKRSLLFGWVFLVFFQRNKGKEDRGRRGIPRSFPSQVSGEVRLSFLVLKGPKLEKTTLT